MTYSFATLENATLAALFDTVHSFVPSFFVMFLVAVFIIALFALMRFGFGNAMISASLTCLALGAAFVVGGWVTAWVLLGFGLLLAFSIWARITLQI